MSEKQMVEQRTWQEFREAKLLWWINRILHTFGWAIVLEQEEDGSISAAYPARVKFRGFDESAEEEGFIGLSQYMAGVSGDLLVEVLEDECVFVVEDQRSSLEDEVRAMTDEELQLKAAELMEWEIGIHKSAASFGIWLDGEWCWVRGPKGSELSIPDYPNDIAAWELAERIPEGYALEIHVGRMVLLSRIGEAVIGAGSLKIKTFDEVARFVGSDNAANITRAFVLARMLEDRCP